VAQGVHGHTLVDLGKVGCFMNGTVELSCGKGIDRVHAWKQPTTVEHSSLSSGHSPPYTQAFQQYRRNHGVPILASLALFHAQRHALAVDVGHPE
jgi:hypothetical protein